MDENINRVEISNLLIYLVSNMKTFTAPTCSFFVGVSEDKFGLDIILHVIHDGSDKHHNSFAVYDNSNS